MLPCLSHNQAAVRGAALAATAELVLATDGGVWERVAPHAAQRVFDPTPRVRLQLAGTLGRWLRAMPDRYSYWYKVTLMLKYIYLVCPADNCTNYSWCRWC